MRKIILFIFISIPFFSFAQKNPKPVCLFSPSGDTVLTFGGGINDTSFFAVEKRVNDTLALLERFSVTLPKGPVTQKELPAEILKKYNLLIQAEIVSAYSCADIHITEKVLVNKKIISLPDPWGNVYDRDIKVSINVCNKLVKEMVVKVQYQAPEKDNSVIPDDFIKTLIYKMPGRNTYYMTLQVLKTDFDSTGKIKNAASVFFQHYLITCPANN